MTFLHPLLRRSAGLIALVLAFAVLVGSLCPRGWFVCMHEDTVALTGAGHAADQGGCDDDCCPEDGCLDLAISLVLDDQTAAANVPVALPVAPVVEFLPDARRGVAVLELPRHTLPGDPPLPDLIRHVRLLV